MLSKAPIVCCVLSLLVLSLTSPTDAFGSDLLQQLTDLLFGGDEDSSEESMETVINTKPNATLTVVCTSGCDLNVMCINCTSVNAAMMPPPATAAPAGTSGNTGAESGSAMAAPASAPAMPSNSSAAPPAAAPTMSPNGMTDETTSTTAPGMTETTTQMDGTGKTRNVAVTKKG